MHSPGHALPQAADAAAAGRKPPAYTITQPISTTAALPEPSVANQATAAFDQARAAFKAGAYDQALPLVQQALGQMPNDTTMHEFLALVYFAQGKYDQAAAPLYAVLSVGPGWDWTTLSGMYPDVDTYTRQLRALEAYLKANPKSAQARFVLAYQYLSEGDIANGVGQLKKGCRAPAGRHALGAASRPASAGQCPPAGVFRCRRPRRAGRAGATCGEVGGHAREGREHHPGNSGRRSLQLGHFKHGQAPRDDRRHIDVRRRSPYPRRPGRTERCAQRQGELAGPQPLQLPARRRTAR